MDNEKYREYCIALQNVFLSILFGLIIYIFYLNKLHTKSILEIFAIVGGNIALISKIHHLCSKLLLIILSWCDTRELQAIKRKSSIDLTNSNIQIDSI